MAPANPRRWEPRCESADTCVGEQGTSYFGVFRTTQFGLDTLRRECLNHVVVVGERHLLGILSKYVDYYNRTRTHLSLAKDAPESRSVQPPSQGRVVAVPRVGGLHHEYLRQAA